MTDHSDESFLEEEQPSERVREILDVGSRLFAEKGFEATSMRDIASAAGVSKALLYHHFNSKDDLFARISFSATQDLYSYVSQRVPKVGSAQDKVRAYMIAAASFFAQNRASWMAASNAFWSDPDRHRLEKRVARRRLFEVFLRDLISEGIENGEFNAIDPAIAGRLILSSINWMSRWFDPTKEKTAEEVVEQYANIILHGIEKR